MLRRFQRPSKHRSAFMLRRFLRPPRYIDRDLRFDDFYDPRSIDPDLCFGGLNYFCRSIDRDLCFGESTRASTTNDIAPPPLYWRTKAASAKLDKSPSKHTSQTGIDTVPNAPDTSPCAAPAARLPPNVPFTVPWSVIRRFARRRRWASGLNGHSLRTTRAQLAGPRYDPWSVTPRFALRRPWPSSLRMRRGTNVAQTPSKTSPRIACATHRPRLPQRSAHRSPVGHPALGTSSTLAVEPANTTPHECHANTFADIATNRLHDAPAASPQPSRPPFPRRSPGALHLVDPGSGPADPKGRKLNAHPGGPVTRARPTTHRQCQQNAPRSSPSHPRQSALSAWPEQCCIFVNTDGPRAKSHSGGASMKAVQRVDRMKPRSR